MADQKHIHLIGICGTADGVAGGHADERGFQVTGSDAAAIRRCGFLASLKIPVAQPFDARISNPSRSGGVGKRDVARESGTGVRARRKNSVLLAPANSGTMNFSAREGSHRRRRHARQDHDHLDASWIFIPRGSSLRF